MPSLLDLRRRIRAVKSTQQITKAMKMISASKLRRAQDRVMGARPFAQQMARVLNSLASRVDPVHASAAGGAGARTPSAKTLLIVVTADKGLCGGVQHQHHQGRRARSSRRAGRRTGRGSRARAVGRKGRDFFKRRGFEIRFEEIGIFQRVKYADAQRIARAAIEEFTSGRASSVYIVYNEFKSVMQQRIVTEQLLPIPKGRGLTPASQASADPGRQAPVAGRRGLPLRAGAGEDLRGAAAAAHRDSGVSRAARVGRGRARRAHDGDGRGHARTRAKSSTTSRCT